MRLMKKGVRILSVMLIVVICFYTGYRKGYNYGRVDGLKTAAGTVTSVKETDSVSVSPEATKIPITSEKKLPNQDVVELDKTAMAFMPEYGQKVLASQELESDTVYRVSMTLPEGYWNERSNNLKFGVLPYDNVVSAEMYYPSEVKEGETEKIVIKASVNGETLRGEIAFTGKSDLRLIQGGDTPEYLSAGGDLALDEGALQIRFYTGATDEYDHPNYTASYGTDELMCRFYRS